MLMFRIEDGNWRKLVLLFNCTYFYLSHSLENAYFVGTAACDVFWYIDTRDGSDGSAQRNIVREGQYVRIIGNLRGLQEVSFLFYLNKMISRQKKKKEKEKDQISINQSPFPFFLPLSFSSSFSLSL